MGCCITTQNHHTALKVFAAALRIHRTFIVSFCGFLFSLAGLISFCDFANADTLQIKKPIVVTEQGSQTGDPETVDGKVLIEAQDGSLLFQELDGTLRVLTAEQVVKKTIDEEPLNPLNKKSLGRRC